ncbi:MAG: DUF89 family protein [Candidatus Aenigmarchaeota archaeon]|nr:DUF89 family protein [Candidatus Aenigmarchaeota archaeon]
MKTYIECLPCFLNQAIKVLKLSVSDSQVQEKAVKEVMKMFSEIDLDKKPPEFARLVYEKISDITGIEDPYEGIKKRDNEHALSLAPMLKNTMRDSKDSLLTAVKAAIAGNIMDFAANSDYNLRETINRILKEDFAINDYGKFKKDVMDAKVIAYFADNSGEIVIDRLLVEKIRTLNKECIIHFFVKAKPIINDATMTDADAVGLSCLKYVEIKTLDGEFLSKSAKYMESVNYLKSVDMVISKGQGNYERLSDIDANIYFLLIAKCAVIARDLNVGLMTPVLKCNKSENCGQKRSN